MSFPQSTFEEIVESEQQMVLKANDRFGRYWATARESSIFLSRCVASFNQDRMHFGRFLAILKKHHTLAILSTVRLHRSQAMMSLRQALEAGASAAFALANPEDKHFFERENGLIHLPKKLPGKRYDWLDKNHKTLSDVIKTRKDLINTSQSHANVLGSTRIFSVEGDQANVPFFDYEDVHLVQVDLWLAAATALDVMILLREVNTARNVIEFMDNFGDHLSVLERRVVTLTNEMKATERYQNAAAFMKTQTDAANKDD